MRSFEKIKTAKTLKDLRKLLTQDEEGLKRYVYPRLLIGDVWWIPDEVTGIGDRVRHPWVIVQGYSPMRAEVRACLRTTKTGRTNSGIITPAGILPELEKEGLIVLRHRVAFIPSRFREFDYIGRLPGRWINEINKFYGHRQP